MQELEKIRVLIVDDVPETCQNIRCLLNFEPRVEVIGEARNGEEAVTKAEALRPDIVLMDINMPILDGIAATEAISCGIAGCAIIIMSVQGEQEYLRQAMVAGAREYIVKPFTSDELISSIYRVYDLEQRRQVKLQGELQDTPGGEVITVFSTKGGVGKSTIAVNLGVSLSQEFGFSVAIVDLDLQFGDVAVLLNLIPRQTISDLAAEMNHLDEELLESYLVRHGSGVRVLAAPSRPEYAELVSAELVEKVIKILQDCYDYVIIDTPGLFTDSSMVALDYSQQILLILSLDLPTLKNNKLGLEALNSLNHKDKIKVVLNRSTLELGIGPEDVEMSLGVSLTAQLPSDGRVVVGAVNKGKPFVLSHPQSRVAESLRYLAREIARSNQKASKSTKKSPGLIGGLLGALTN
ncbi:MAG TPA: response regulator [Syntrophomonadaceae bacterium]|nr:response regulator [Syntrophomonadaceae bacterium]